MDTWLMADAPLVNYSSLSHYNFCGFRFISQHDNFHQSTIVPWIWPNHNFIVSSLISQHYDLSLTKVKFVSCLVITNILSYYFTLVLDIFNSLVYLNSSLYHVLWVKIYFEIIIIFSSFMTLFFKMWIWFVRNQDKSWTWAEPN